MRKTITHYLFFLLTGLLYLFLVDPSQSPLIALLIPFIWLAIGLYISSYRLLNKFFNSNNSGAVSKKYKLWAALASSIVTFLCILRSLHQLTPRDLGIAVGFACIAMWYSRKIELSSLST